MGIPLLKRRTKVLAVCAEEFTEFRWDFLPFDDGMRLHRSPGSIIQENQAR